jgi:hypothetical protein
MTHPVTPLVEVAAPNGTKSLLAAFSVARADAVATVKKVIPPTYTAELSSRHVPPGLKFGGARPGDIILIKHSHAGWDRLGLLCNHGIMKKKTVIPKKKHGKPATGKGEPVVVRIHPPQLKALDAWIAQQEPPFP